ncbi:hypothetical protein BC937DRAFT_88827 [Endogone sp. FLAS-F59071]|nr:hypothetical protein BC937DRAFT_88827 [Endogone sp. FLAS-F59071]|eukprot:RUS18384.1 hypothetical protein BC937DRAFT_88827 [Endogone sp. FLAS-F59071]
MHARDLHVIYKVRVLEACLSFSLIHTGGNPIYVVFYFISEEERTSYYHEHTSTGDTTIGNKSDTNLQKRRLDDADIMNSTTLNASDVQTNAADGETDIQRAWEFDEPVPAWLEKIDKHRLPAVSVNPKKQLQAASTAAWWRIVIPVELYFYCHRTGSWVSGAGRVAEFRI